MTSGVGVVEKLKVAGADGAAVPALEELNENPPLVPDGAGDLVGLNENPPLVPDGAGDLVAPAVGETKGFDPPNKDLLVSQLVLELVVVVVPAEGVFCRALPASETSLLYVATKRS